MTLTVLDGGVTAPKGYLATGCAAGLKKTGKNDMAILMSQVPATVAACFTSSVVKAAPVLRDKALLAAGDFVTAVVANSGNANACTGEAGKQSNQEMAQTLADLLEVPVGQVWTASTGVIGAPFPIEKVKAGIAKAVPTLSDSREAANEAAKGIMTTDTYSKEIAISFELDGKTVTIGGMAKGSGMICPDLATMLAFVTTDCAISQEMLQKALSADVKDTYNMVSVDGDESTNDTLIVLANGRAGNEAITTEGPAFDAFCEALNLVNTTLAQHLARDGEGATKLVIAKVTGAKTEEDARKLAKSVIQSSLVKAAMFGQDANWGRILAAMGYAGAKFNPDHVDISYLSPAGNIDLFVAGTPIDFDEDKALKILKENEITVDIQVHEGWGNATAWGCDLSYDYVKINGDYRT